MAEGVWTPQVVPDGYTGFKTYCGNANVFNCIDDAGYAAGDVAILPDGSIYRWDGDSWNSLSVGGGGGGGTTQIATGTSDPVGAPAAGIVFFSRTDVVRLLKWNGSAWVIEYSEI